MSEIDALRRAADAGNPAAQVRLAFIHVVGREAPRDLPEALRLPRAGCAQNFTDALRFHATLAVLGLGRPRDFDEAIDLLDRAARHGDVMAQRQLAVLGGREGFDAHAWLTPPQAVQHFHQPRVFTIENFLPEASCAWLIERSRDRLGPAMVLHEIEQAQVRSPLRTNTLTSFSMLEADLVFQLMHLRMSAIAGLPFMHQEPTNILHYDVGEEFKPHADFFRQSSSTEAFADDLRRLGQRIGTLLVYLNDDYEGGATAFPKLNWTFRGKTGDALLFWNVSASGELEYNSLHAGLPVTRGEKWLVSKWFRARSVPF